MTPLAVVELIEGYIKRARRVRPADHRNPHAFAEDMSEFIGEMAADVKRYRAMATPARVVRPVREIATGTRTIGRRDIRVETRARRA